MLEIAAEPEHVPEIAVEPEPVAEPAPETPEEVYVHALAEVYTEDSETVHKIRNLPHLDGIPHVDGIPQVEPPPKGLDDLFPPADETKST